MELNPLYSIPCSAFRRFTTIIVMLGEYRFRGRLPPRNQQVRNSYSPLNRFLQVEQHAIFMLVAAFTRAASYPRLLRHALLRGT